MTGVTNSFEPPIPGQHISIPTQTQYCSEKIYDISNEVSKSMSDYFQSDEFKATFAKIPSVKPSEAVDIVLNDFQPINSWVEENGGETFDDKTTTKYIIDLSTNRKYWNQPTWLIRIKGFLLCLGTPLVHLVASVYIIGIKSIRLISFWHFWKKAEPDQAHFIARLADAGTDLLHLIAAPFVYVALECAALYTVILPHDGRKLYASIERAQYGQQLIPFVFPELLAPCFQPSPTKHLFRGDPNGSTAC